MADEFVKFGTLIGQYNSTLPTLTDGDLAVASLDANGRVFITADNDVPVVFSNSTIGVTQDTSPWVVSNNGTFAVQEDGDALTALQLIDDLVLVDGTAWGGVAVSKGAELLAVRHDAAGPLAGIDDGEMTPLQVNDQGELKVAGSFAVTVDDIFESGTEADKGSDATGDGVVPITTSLTNVVVIPVALGDVLYITGLDISSDKQIQWELIVDDNGTPTEWIRTGTLGAGVPKECVFERAIEVTGGATISVILRAKSLTSAGSAGGGINAYVRTP